MAVMHTQIASIVPSRQINADMIFIIIEENEFDTAQPERVRILRLRTAHWLTLSPDESALPEGV